ncbi:transposase [Demequina pelophila]|uniref:transposase n=1 Tax=Demequina pelophila TaxID=1638984 RepID=UPI000AC6A289|nr:transposase [Demequina pelophila]
MVRRRALDLLEPGKSVARVAHDLEVSQQAIHRWRRQDRVDEGWTEKSELAQVNGLD